MLIFKKIINQSISKKWFAIIVMFNIDYLNIWGQMGIFSRTLAFLFLFVFVFNIIRLFLSWGRGFSLVAIGCSTGIFFFLIYIAFIFEWKLLFIAPLVLVLVLAMSHVAKLGVWSYYGEEMDETIFSLEMDSKWSDFRI